MGFVFYNIDCLLSYSSSCLVKFGMNLTQADVDGFEASKFALTTSVINELCIQVGMPSEQSHPLPSHVPLSSVSDIRSIHSDLVSIHVVSDGDK